MTQPHPTGDRKTMSTPKTPMDWDKITDFYRTVEGQEIVDFLITHVLSEVDKQLGGLGWDAYDSDGGLDEAVRYEVHALLRKNQAIEEWDNRPLGPLLMKLIRLTDKDSKNGKWRVTLDYDNYQDGGRVLDADEKVIGECYDDRPGNTDEEGPDSQLVAAIIKAVDKVKRRKKS